MCLSSRSHIFVLCFRLYFVYFHSPVTTSLIIFLLFAVCVCVCVCVCVWVCVCVCECVCVCVSLLQQAHSLFVGSSSLGATNSIFECFGLLSTWFPLIAILDAANPILYFQFLRAISYVVFPSVVWSPLWSYWHRFPLIYFFTILSSAIRYKWPNHLNRCALM